MINELPKRFMDKVKQNDSCWLWTASKTNSGYGRYKLEGKAVSAHRFCWEHINGIIPDTMYVLHKCDVRDCVNPDHLFLGTHQENMDDMVIKGREPSKEKSGMAKLNELQVKEIRETYQFGKKNSEYSIRGLAKNFGVDSKTIWNIIRNKIWKAS